MLRAFGNAAPDAPADEPAPIPDTSIGQEWFEEPVCRNCGAARNTAYCGVCGQKAAERFTWRDLRKEGWERLRYFEFKSLKTLGQLIIRPGTVARAYVMGRRTKVMHPLTLLVALVALLVLILAANRYFGHYGFADRDVDRMAEQVLAYANWSFSLGIAAILFGSWSVFRHRLGYNVIEHAILAIYVQAIVLAVIIVNMLPTLIWRDPGFIAAHRQASQHYMYIIKLVIVALAYRQFFVLDLRRDWHRLLLACLLFVGSSWLLLRAYAALILWIVTRTN